MRNTVVLHLLAWVEARVETPGKYPVTGPSMGVLSFLSIATNVSMILCARMLCKL